MLWYSSDFTHPETGVLCRFCINTSEEVIFMQVSPNALRAGMVPNWEHARSVCKRWGTYSCGSQAEAARIILSSFPDILNQWSNTIIWNL